VNGKGLVSMPPYLVGRTTFIHKEVLAMWHMGDGWGWWMAFGWIWMLGFWAVIIWAVYALTNRREGGQDNLQAGGETPLEIAARRYARGELSDEQYEAMRRRLNHLAESSAA
jgi:putative membrane protein